MTSSSARAPLRSRASPSSTVTSASTSLRRCSERVAETTTSSRAAEAAGATRPARETGRHAIAGIQAR
ncbi:hypothetical protein PV794_03185 [Comamonas aquatica]|nr:hypothetical protein [Comamonas aquatica]